MKYLSLCSGIEAATVAWHPLGWEAVAYSEIERFPSEVLAHHYPSTPNLGDMTKFKEWSIESNVDLLVGGTPCQSFSVAGLRKGLDDPRGNLMLTYLAIADKYKPKWIVWENVPGVLSSNGGKDFGVFLGALGELGYGFAYRILDAQYFGVAQRRRRVFVVGYLGDWRRAAAVLFERHSLQGHPAPSREKGQAIAPSVTTGPPFSRTGNDRVECEAMVISKCLTARGAGGQNQDPETATLLPIAIQDVRPIEKAQNGRGWNDDGTAYTVDTHATQGVAHPKVVGALACNTGPNGHDAGNFACNQAVDAGHVLPVNMAVRRLTPVECERLQGFPDSYTDIKSKNKPTPDGPRYKALGNSMAVPVMAWIGQRIEQVEAICKQNK
jgi:DNA (cytosine-5)-methyltransferase 1